MKYQDLDTPALLIDQQIMLENILNMQRYADSNHVKLRPHTKTHKMPELAAVQCRYGACGIAVAKVGEAEVMAAQGLDDIFIANEIVGSEKLKRIADLASQINISFGVDSPYQVIEADRVFSAAKITVPVLIEIEVGEKRSGIIEDVDFIALLSTIRSCDHVSFRGIFSHDGNSYEAESLEECFQIAGAAQCRTLHFAQLAQEYGMPCEVVSYGATPTLMNRVPILKGITELRPGTYILMDASQGNAVGTLSHCAATVLATVISKPTDTRTILDVGAKGLTMQKRTVGICATPGMGTIYEHTQTHIDSVYDEHAILYDQSFHDSVKIGDKVRIIPVHICPVCNLYDQAYLINGDNVVAKIPILCRGKLC